MGGLLVLGNRTNRSGTQSLLGGLKRIAYWLKRRAENICAAMLAVMFVAFIIQVFLRYVVNWPVGWTTEVCTITWLWGILWGASFVVKDSAEIRFDIIYNAVSPRTRSIFRIISGIALILLYLIAFPDTISYITFMKVENTSYTGIRFDYLFSIYCLFVLAVVVRYSWVVGGALKDSLKMQTRSEQDEGQ